MLEVFEVSDISSPPLYFILQKPKKFLNNESVAIVNRLPFGPRLSEHRYNIDDNPFLSTNVHPSKEQ